MESEKEYSLISVPQQRRWGPFESEDAAWHYLFGRDYDEHDIAQHQEAGWSVELRDEVSCTWTEDDDGVWSTQCGEMFEFTNDGLPENRFEFCPYCGKYIKVRGTLGKLNELSKQAQELDIDY